MQRPESGSRPTETLVFATRPARRSLCALLPPNRTCSLSTVSHQDGAPAGSLSNSRRRPSDSARTRSPAWTGLDRVGAKTHTISSHRVRKRKRCVPIRNRHTRRWQPETSEMAMHQTLEMGLIHSACDSMASAQRHMSQRTIRIQGHGGRQVASIGQHAVTFLNHATPFRFVSRSARPAQQWSGRRRRSVSR
jgi:hypothetical protein